MFFEGAAPEKERDGRDSHPGRASTSATPLRTTALFDAPSAAVCRRSRGPPPCPSSRAELRAAGSASLMASAAYIAALVARLPARPSVSLSSLPLSYNSTSSVAMGQ